MRFSLMYAWRSEVSQFSGHSSRERELLHRQQRPLCQTWATHCLWNKKHRIKLLFPLQTHSNSFTNLWATHVDAEPSHTAEPNWERMATGIKMAHALVGSFCFSLSINEQDNNVKLICWQAACSSCSHNSTGITLWPLAVCLSRLALN